MSWNFDDVQVCGQLRVGTGIVDAIKEGDTKINGSMHAEGPVVFGGPTEFSDNLATLMVGRTKNDDKDCVPAKRSLYVKGNTVIEGDDGTSNALHITGNTKSKGNITCTASETFTVHETPKIILKSTSLTQIKGTGMIDLAANSCLKLYGSIIKGVTDACSVKDSKCGTQREQKKNSQIEGG